MNEIPNINHPIDVVVHYVPKDHAYAQEFFSLCSVLNNSSDAAEFNKNIRANKYDPAKAEGNEPQFSNKHYELYIGYDESMKTLDEVFNSMGLHINITGRKACIYVDNGHTDSNQYVQFRRFVKGYTDQLKKTLTVKSESGLVVYGQKVRETLDACTSKEGYFDLPKYFKLIGHGIVSGVKWVTRKLGFGRQKEIHEEKYKFLVQFFYLVYFPQLVTEK